MAAQKTTRDSGGRKSEVITIRLDPRLKYLAELAARRQRRPLSSYVEWAIEQSLEIVQPAYQSVGPDAGKSFAQVASSLWDVNIADRFANLALSYPDLLTHEEQILWKQIKECPFVWKLRRMPGGLWEWTISPSSLLRDRLKEHWALFEKVARGDASPDALPQTTETTAVFENPGDEMDDEIPF
jgi:hypothetical protein